MVALGWPVGAEAPLMALSLLGEQSCNTLAFVAHQELMTWRWLT
jgi:hypothetical protein